MDVRPESAVVCPNCGTGLQGRWCHACGQKRIEPEERTLRWLAGEFVAGLTNLDSKFLRSLRALFVQPGRLGAEWLAGRRASWTSPIALFLCINLVYFFVPQLSDLNLSLREQLGSQVHSPHAQALVEARLAARGVTLDEYADQYAFESVNLAKTLIILHVPPFALLLLFLSRRRDIALVDHMAVSLHIWAAWLAILVAVPLLMTVGMATLGSLGASVSDDAARLVMRVILLAITLGYFHGTMRRAYGFRWWPAMLCAPVLFVGAMLTHFLYRAVQFYLTFALT